MQELSDLRYWLRRHPRLAVAFTTQWWTCHEMKVGLKSQNSSSENLLFLAFFDKTIYFGCLDAYLRLAVAFTTQWWTCHEMRGGPKAKLE